MTTPDLDFSDVRGLDDTVRQVAAAALRGESMILVGPPGIGKTMIARRVPGLLGPLSILEECWLRAEYDAAGLTLPRKRTAVGYQTGETFDIEPASRPFRAPHHTISTAALTGGYTLTHRATCAFLTATIAKCNCDRKERRFRAGELQLARHGVLMLDEVAELATHVVGDLATMISTGHGAGRMARPPLIIATTIPCPCGWRATGVRQCNCTDAMVNRWQQRQASIVGQLKIKHTIPIRSLSLSDMRNAPKGPTTAELRAAFAGGV